MTKRDALEVAVKILGLYSLFTFAINICTQVEIICTAFGLLAVGQERPVANPVLYIVFCCLSPLVQLTFAFVFLRGGRRIAELLVRESLTDTEGQMMALPLHDRMALWISILGLYFFVSGIVQFAAHIPQLVSLLQDANWRGHIQVLTPILQLGVSLVLICRARSVAVLIGGKTPNPQSH